MKKQMRLTIPQLGILFIILLSSLGCMSVSYSIWTEDVDIQGSITICQQEQSETSWARMYNNPNDFTYEFPGHNWATYIRNETTETPTTYYLYAAQQYLVGDISVNKNTTHLFIEFQLYDDYIMTELHVHISSSLEDIPLANGNPIPGLFDYKRNYNQGVTEYRYILEWMDSWNEQDLYIAAHAVVWGWI